MNDIENKMIVICNNLCQKTLHSGERLEMEEGEEERRVRDEKEGKEGEEEMRVRDEKEEENEKRVRDQKKKIKISVLNCHQKALKCHQKFEK